MNQNRSIKNKKMKFASRGTVDRFNALPDSLLYHILSFLDMKEVVQTSFISRKWRYLWRSVPVLNFDYTLWKDSSKLSENLRPYVKKVYRKDECLDFVERVLLSRDRSANIQKIRLSYNYCCDSGRLNNWLVFALEKHLEDVHLEIPKDDLHVLPDSLFMSRVKVFKLKSYHSKISVQLPESISSAHQLRLLELVSVLLPSNSSGYLVLNCPALEGLILKHCDHKNLKLLCVSAHQLKNLVLDNWDTNHSCEIDICTPNLISLELARSSYKKYTVGSFSCLASAKIYFGSECMVEVLKYLHNVTNLKVGLTYEREPDVLLNELLNPFPSLRCLKLTQKCGYSLELAGLYIQALANFSMSSPSIETLVLGIFPMNPERKNMLDELLIPFSNLRFLKLTGLENGLCVQAMVDILKNAPIETLFLKISPDSCWNKCNYDWETKLTELSSMQYVFHNLRYVTVLNSRCDEKELKILGFVVKNALVLEKITVCLYSCGRKYNKKESAQMLYSLPKASSNVGIYVYQKKS